jgi:hypothetical protein
MWANVTSVVTSKGSLTTPCQISFRRHFYAFLNKWNSKTCDFLPLLDHTLARSLHLQCPDVAKVFSKKVGVGEVECSFSYCIHSPTTAGKASVSISYWQTWPIRLIFLSGGTPLWLPKFLQHNFWDSAHFPEPWRPLLVLMRWGLCPSGRQQHPQAQDLVSPWTGAF